MEIVDACLPAVTARARTGATIDLRTASNDRLRRLVEEHFAAIWKLLRRLGVAQAAVDDAAQEVFMVAARRIDVIAPGSEHSFLYGTALRVAGDYRRRQTARREITGLDVIDRAHHPGEDPGAALDQHRARAMLDVVIAEMSDDVRDCFVLHELEGLEMKAIAEMLAIPGGTVASRLRRAREEFSASARRLRLRMGLPATDASQRSSR